MKRSFGENLFNVLYCMLMVLIMLLTLYPFIYVLFASFSNA